jgi:hypothetical protein
MITMQLSILWLQVNSGSWNVNSRQQTADVAGQDSGPPGREFLALGPLAHGCATHTGGQAGESDGLSRRWP